MTYTSYGQGTCAWPDCGAPAQGRLTCTYASGERYLYELCDAHLEPELELQRSGAETGEVPVSGVWFAWLGPWAHRQVLP